MKYKKENDKFVNLTYNDFRDLAKDNSLSKYEKIGFPDDYRKNYENEIFKDILSKLPELKKNNQNVLDIGPGCSDLPKLFINHTKKHKSKLFLVDSQEMLNLIPNETHVKKIPGYFPDIPLFINSNLNKFDIIISYSVFHYIYIESNIFNFIENALKLLKPGGSLLIGDLPNNDKRKRYLTSKSGIKFHKKFMNTTKLPDIKYDELEESKIDDSIIMAILLKYRNYGFESYLLEQNNNLPLANRREDIIIKKRI